MEEEKLYGKLFNSIPLHNEGHLDVILQSMDISTANVILIQAVKHAFHSGMYSLAEAETISKAIRILSKSQTNEEE